MIADFVSTMEAHRGVKRFESGGYSNAAPRAPGASGSQRNPVSATMDMSPMLKKLDNIHMAIQNQEVTLNYQYFQREINKIVQINSNANAGARSN